MSSPEPIASSPLDRLRARFLRLASDPRAGVIPEGRQTLRELVGLLDQVTELERRVAAIEHGLAGVHFRDELRCDES